MNESEHRVIEFVVRDSYEVDVVGEAGREIISGRRRWDFDEWNTGSDQPRAKKRDVKF
jgi:hypothetical protein